MESLFVRVLWFFTLLTCIFPVWMPCYCVVCTALDTCTYIDATNRHWKHAVAICVTLISCNWGTPFRCVLLCFLSFQDIRWNINDINEQMQEPTCDFIASWIFQVIPHLQFWPNCPLKRSFFQENHLFQEMQIFWMPQNESRLNLSIVLKSFRPIFSFC